MKKQGKEKREAGPHLPEPRELPLANVLVDPETKRPLIKPGTET